MVWVLARQHPGESMAEFFAEGLLRRLLDPHDATACKLLREAVFYVVRGLGKCGGWCSMCRWAGRRRFVQLVD